MTLIKMIFHVFIFSLLLPVMYFYWKLQNLLIVEFNLTTVQQTLTGNKASGLVSDYTMTIHSYNYYSCSLLIKHEPAKQDISP